MKNLEKITSVHNQHVKDWKKLQTRKQRTKTNTYLLDGWHLVNEAIQSDISILTLIGTQEQFELHPDILTHRFDTYEVTSEIMTDITDSVTPQGIAAVVSKPEDDLQIPAELTGAWLLLDQIQDPGNIGTMIRTADAAGFTGVVAGRKTVDIYSPKVVRAMQGSQFHIQLHQGNLIAWIEQFKQNELPVYGSELNEAAKNFRKIAPSDNFALVMGNEGHGMSQELLDRTTQNLYIPMAGQAESLNVAISAGILMFQLKQK
ncbi:tRNA rRNA methyltransferase SpoU [Paucilactobacillus hokkaidonensis]|uniref:tRNA rRNA methyltransferase SpoU n=1 Tax=Paucilactobacillus hokkaidonensis TaxID=1193095 RepID=A0ABR5Q376_9LACO|nr:tRNA rRNA methyltransferase SpoU [Paucilactobacillus hokkaidonensis]